MGIAHASVVTDNVDVVNATKWNALHVLHDLIPSSVNDYTLGSAGATWADLFLGDGSVIYFGDNQEVTLTHIHNVGLLLNAAMQLQFRDAAVYISSKNDGYLDLDADTGIRLNGAVSAVITLSMNNQLTNTLAIGTAPFVITSTTLVSNLNVERWGGFLVSSAITLTNTTDSTTKDTGALILEGGLGVEKSIVIGGGITVGTTNSFIPNLYGGAGSGGNLFLSSTTHLTKGNIQFFSANTYISPTESMVLAGGLTATTGTLGYLKTSLNIINEEFSDSDTTLAFNVKGYAGGTTRFRDLEIYDGKNALIATFKGSDKSTTLVGGLIVGSDIVSDTADTDSLGSTSKEWLNLYIGDAGKIYLGLGQDITIYRSGANAMTITASSGITFNGNLAFTSTQTVDGVDISGLLIKTTKVTDLLTIWDKTTKIATGDTDFADQAVKTTSTVTFVTVDTGQGANELYDMDQNVLTSSTPTFAGEILTSFIKFYGDATHYWNLGFLATNNLIIQPEQVSLGNILIRDNGGNIKITLNPYDGSAIFVGGLTTTSGIVTIQGGAGSGLLTKTILTGGGASWYTMQYNMKNELFEITRTDVAKFSLDASGNVIQSGGITAIAIYSDTVGATNRDLYVDDTGIIGYISSSIRYKTNIVNMTDAKWLYNLQPVIFDRKDGSSFGEWGLIAEDVAKIASKFVSYDEEGKPETVSYGSLINPVIVEMKNLNNRMNILNKEKEQLRLRIKTLEQDFKMFK